jgi:S1-C subfamily serine protease
MKHRQLINLLALCGLTTAFVPAFSADSTKAEVGRLGKAATVFVVNKATQSSGSAFCVHPSGLFITNEHVARGARELTLVLNAGQKEEKVLTARVVRVDAGLDLALLAVDGVKDLPSLPLGTVEKLSELDDLIACGFPFGQQLALDKKEYPSISINFGAVSSLRQRDGELHRYSGPRKLDHPLSY